MPDGRLLARENSMAENSQTVVSIPGIEDEDNALIFGVSLQDIYSMLVINWQWFLLSLLISLCGAVGYLYYKSPTYQVKAHLLIKYEEKRNKKAGEMLANMSDLGIISNSTGVYNEMMIIQSHVLVREAVHNLRLYVSYKIEGAIKNHLVFQGQPFNAELDSHSLTQLDSLLPFTSKRLELAIAKSEGSGYDISYTVFTGGKPAEDGERHVQKFPVILKTSIGNLTLTNNPKADKKLERLVEEGHTCYITVNPPMRVASYYVNNMTVEPADKKFDNSIVVITLKDKDLRQAISFITELVRCYNVQANVDKNEIALKTEEFINGRLEKIDVELGDTEGRLEKYKRQHSVTMLNLDATTSLTQTSMYADKLSEVNSQIQLLDYLRQYIDNPSNMYQIIPSNVGMTDGASTTLIANFNETVQERNRILKAANEQLPQVQMLTSSLDDLRVSIREALLQARNALDIKLQGIQREYAKYNLRISNSPEQERVLTQIGRQQEVKSGLYLLLLQKREENSISLAATADKGKLIDLPQPEGKISPKKSIVLLFALLLGILIPFLVLFLQRKMQFRLEGRGDVEHLTSLPIIADVPIASETVKTAEGIVVHADTNSQIDEIFRSLRTNIQFMMPEKDKVILFTSSISGEGKTFLAANLSVSFALLGKKVILCGLDIRKPALGRLFAINDRKQGITNLLPKDDVSWDDCQCQIVPSGVIDGLDLMMAGIQPPNPTELLARQSMADILDILKEHYDYIILDTAPVGLVTDTLQISRYASVCCYVCRADYTPKSDFTAVNTLAKENKLVNTCIVLNGVDMSKKKYGYYYGYGKYGKYGRYGYGNYGKYGKYGRYGSYGNYAQSHYGKAEDNSIKK